MPPLTLSPTDSATLTRSLAGSDVEQTILVSGLGGNAVARMTAALAAPGIPALGQVHPTLPGLYVTSAIAAPAGPTSAAVRILYQSPSRNRLPPPGHPALIEITATLSESTTSVDAAGSPITASVTIAGSTLTQRAQLPRLEPQTTLRYSRTETTNPSTNAQTYVGKINASSIFAAAAGTLMCTAITARSHDAGQTYETRYDFQYRPTGWQPKIIYLDPATNRPNPNASEQSVTLYPSAEFADLAL